MRRRLGSQKAALILEHSEPIGGDQTGLWEQHGYVVQVANEAGRNAYLTEEGTTRLIQNAKIYGTFASAIFAATSRGYDVPQEKAKAQHLRENRV